MATKDGQSILRAQYHIRNKGSSRCPDHRDNDVVLLCQTCNVLICTSCSITSHKSHIDSFLEISKIRNQHQNSLQDFVNEAEKIKIPKLNDQIISAREELSACQPKYKNISDNIKKQRDECRLELDKIMEDNLAICDKMERAETHLLHGHIVNLEVRLDTLVKLSSDCKQTLQTGNAVLVYDTVVDIKDRDFDIPQTTNTDMTEFTPGKDRQSHLEQAMGKWKTPEHLKTELATSGCSNQGPVVIPKLFESKGMQREILFKLCDSLTVISKFLYPFSITSICPTNEGRAWLSDWATNTVKLINNKGQLVQKIQHNSDIQQISLDPATGRMWFCCTEEKTIHELSTSSTPVTRFTTKGLPFSLCVINDGQIVVGESGVKVCKLVMYTADGRVLHTATVEASGFGPVWSITQCAVTGNIAVASTTQISGDSSNPERSQLVVYNPTLQHLFQYRGEGIKEQEEAISPERFDPGIVVYDSKGNIVVTDRTRHTIELISGTGTYIKTLHVNKEQLGVIGIQRGNVLWTNLKIRKRGVKLFKYYCD
ncbi:uncharacterized protein LOC110448629 [Mizuhopecten yessoensis]|uniref:B box-type domain-containing protein n=1 Tax=Mizuhopecten yessoensis TaxID=6573 RepID=A0A210QSV4_MIZYE|nr:uncharacterized protein LOC110448629 [Mizuhopecten yessoensis]OWF51782.1 hypothetical protein KP79_PYT05593 [Mizuhopecten yessoensis]